MRRTASSPGTLDFNCDMQDTCNLAFGIVPGLAGRIKKVQRRIERDKRMSSGTSIPNDILIYLQEPFRSDMEYSSDIWGLNRTNSLTFTAPEVMTCLPIFILPFCLMLAQPRGLSGCQRNERPLRSPGIKEACFTAVAAAFAPGSASAAVRNRCCIAPVGDKHQTVQTGSPAGTVVPAPASADH